MKKLLTLLLLIILSLSVKSQIADTTWFDHAKPMLGNPDSIINFWTDTAVFHGDIRCNKLKYTSLDPAISVGSSFWDTTGNVLSPNLTTPFEVSKLGFVIGNKRNVYNELMPYYYDTAYSAGITKYETDKIRHIGIDSVTKNGIDALVLTFGVLNKDTNGITTVLQVTDTTFALGISDTSGISGVWSSPKRTTIQAQDTGGSVSSLLFQPTQTSFISPRTNITTTFYGGLFNKGRLTNDVGDLHFLQDTAFMPFPLTATIGGMYFMDNPLNIMMLPTTIGQSIGSFIVDVPYYNFSGKYDVAIKRDSALVDTSTTIQQDYKTLELKKTLHNDSIYSKINFGYGSMDITSISYDPIFGFSGRNVVSFNGFYTGFGNYGGGHHAIEISNRGIISNRKLSFEAPNAGIKKFDRYGLGSYILKINTDSTSTITTDTTESVLVSNLIKVGDSVTVIGTDSTFEIKSIINGKEYLFKTDTTLKLWQMPSNGRIKGFTLADTLIYLETAKGYVFSADSGRTYFQVHTALLANNFSNQGYFKTTNTLWADSAYIQPKKRVLIDDAYINVVEKSGMGYVYSDSSDIRKAFAYFSWDVNGTYIDMSSVGNVDNANTDGKEIDVYLLGGVLYISNRSGYTRNFKIFLLK